ncbi:actinorhodin polyketide synthase acyl carrier protein [Actinoplanes cyaneus]|uniref:Actinorhodin polyketide synthase acyl carrier protein n=1 Tax=Actinoplanes cyaneus TaxID=52696 RepID=A0A919IPR7_9ACTN|nr:phosphopantetheine-binding protein [Actinoplanes cyaneus]MCW2139744.1 act minimal PKS acyl carrier protein [Actinoplanes cyaneus]GID69899.1 actinorhodin polyketide synthase acyl carrier protein [Actinoplanes cyaneus]
MPIMTIDDLQRILVSCAGEDDATATVTDSAGRRFDDLGYDSLALMETAARIEQEFGVKLPDDEVNDARTPQELLDLVNGRLATA